jgi:hypothetical protein
VIPAHVHPVVEDFMRRARASGAQDTIHYGGVPPGPAVREIPLPSVP